MACAGVLAFLIERRPRLRGLKEKNDAARDRLKTLRSEANRIRPNLMMSEIQELEQLERNNQTEHDEIMSEMDLDHHMANKALFVVTTPEEMRTLLSLGADVRYRAEGYYWGTAVTALQFFAREGLHEVVDVLLANNAEVDALDDGFTPLWIACRAGDEKMNVVRSLLRGGANEELLDDFLPVAGYNDGICRIVRRYSGLRRLAWLPILRMRGCELNVAVRLSSRLEGSKTARAVMFLVNVAPNGVFGRVASFL